MQYSNSPLVVYGKQSPNKTSPRNHAIDRITIHCYVGQVSIESMAGWLCNPNAKASANYGIGLDGRVGLFVPEQDRSWCSSNRDNDNRAVTIECASASYHPYAINDAVYDKLIELCADICKRNGKDKLIWFGDKDKTLNYTPKANEMIITVHRWFANKACPGDYIYERLPRIAEEVTNKLNKNAVPKESVVSGDRYVVRLTYDRPDTQTNSYNNLDYAKAEANRHPGYSVFDVVTKKAVYTSAEPVNYTELEWIAMVASIAQDLAYTTNILPSVVIAQTCLETGFGKTDLTQKYNILGMKADLINSTWKDYTVWDGQLYSKVTPEYHNGRLIHVTDKFRVYKTFRQCIEDYEQFLLHVRNNKGLKYARIAGVTSPVKAINIIYVGTGTDTNPEGYCTDLKYENKILSLIKQYDLTKYDVVMNKTVKWIGYIKVDGAVIRKGAGATFSKLATLKKGDKIGICSVTKSAVGNTWYYVKYNNTKFGYIYKKRVSKTYIAPEKTIPQKAASIAVTIAKDNSHGYNNSYSGRGGNPDYACSSFVTDCYIKAGVNFGVTCDKVVTSDMKTLFTKHGFADVTKKVNLITGANVRVGDIVLKPGSHVEICTATGKLAGARGNATAMKPENGKSGDQTGSEIAVSNYYDFGQTICLRYVR